MIRSKLVKTFLLGLCMSAMFTGTAFASGGGVSPSYAGEQSEELNKFYEKQGEIDQYVFGEHAQDIRKKGFQVIYTGVSDTHVEIGITPYSEENANYLYDIFGDDIVKVVASEEAVLYKDMAAVSEPVIDTGETADDVAITKAEEEKLAETNSDAPVASTDKEEPIAPDAISEEEPTMEIQIESVSEELSEDELYDLASQSGIVEDAVEEAQVVSATDETLELVSAPNEKQNISAPTIILIIGAGAVIVGAIVLVSSKRKMNK